MTMLPDIDRDSYADYSRTVFEEQNQPQIDALGFGSRNQQRIAELNVPGGGYEVPRISPSPTPVPAPPSPPEPAPAPPPQPAVDNDAVLSSALRSASNPQAFIDAFNASSESDMLTRVGNALESSRAAPVAQAAAPPSIPTQQGGGYAFPVSGYKGEVPLHWGEVSGGADLFSPRGTPVVAMRGGRVTSAGSNPVGGNFVSIRGDDGNEYYYAHLEGAPAVRAGQDVAAGSHLGGVGDSGNAAGKGTHLHIGIGPSIQAGANKYGGTGGSYDATSLLRTTLAGEGTRPSASPQPATQTTAEMSGAAKGSGGLGDLQRTMMGQGAEIASWLGTEGQKALQAILVTEGGMGGAVGDNGQSFGPLQFYGGGGQLNNFARAHGMSVREAGDYVRANPLDAISWAIGDATNPGYLGRTILKGLQMGLAGPALATYAQQFGQVSASPERAGQNYNALFSQAGGPIEAVGGALGGIGQAAGNILGGAAQVVTEAPGRILGPPAQAAGEAVSSILGPGPTLGPATRSAGSVLGTQQQNPLERLGSTISNAITEALAPVLGGAGRDVQSVLGRSAPALAAAGETAGRILGTDVVGGVSPADVAGAVLTPWGAGDALRAFGQTGAGLLLKGPMLLSDDEVLQRSTPDQIDIATRAARITSPGEPTREEIVSILRGHMLGEAYAGERVGVDPLVTRLRPPLDANGRLNGRATDLEDQLTLPGFEPTAEDLARTARGELQAFGERNVPGIGRRTIRSAIPEEGVPIEPPSPETLERMPNLMYMARDDPQLQRLFQRSAEVNDDLADEFRQGVRTHRELIDDLAPNLGMTTEDFLKTRPGQAFNDAELLALRAAVRHGKDNVVDMVDEIVASGGVRGLTPEQKVEYIRTLLDAEQIQQVGRGGAATAARALGQQRINIDRERAAAITGRNEQVAAQRAQAAADTRAKRAEEAAAKTEQLRAEREQAREVARAERERARQQAAEAREAARQGRMEAAEARRIEAERGRVEARVNDLLKQIDAGYEDLARYQNMTLAEKEEWFLSRREAREAQAAMRAEALTNPDPLNELLRQLRKELDAEQKNFAGRRETWQDMAFWDSKRHEILATKSLEGRTEWLKAEAKAARKELAAHEKRVARAWEQQLKERERQVEAAGRIIDKLGGKEITDDLLQKVVDAVSSGDPVLLAKTLKSLQNVSTWDRLAILRYASMLSSLTTHLAQGAGSALQLVTAGVTHPVSVGFDILGQALGGGERTRYMAELPEMLKGGMEGFLSSFGDAAEVMRSGINPGAASRNIETRRTSFGSGNEAVDFMAELPLRMLEAGDTVFRGAGRGGHARGLAMRRAIREGFEGQARKERIDEIMRNLEDYPDLADEASTLARRIVLQEQRRTVQRLGGGREGLAGFAQSLVIPFVRTPVNIAAQGAGLTPAGYLKALNDARAGRRSDAVDAAARATVGTAIMGGAVAMAANDMLTGAMPADAGERSTLPPGWQPYAMRLQLPGQSTPTYIKYSNLGPIGVPMAMAAVAVDASRKGQEVDPAKLVSRFVAGFGRYMVDSTMLQGIGNAIDAVTDPERKGEAFLESLATQFVPYAALGRQIDRALGTGPRDVHGWTDAILSQYPGLSGLVPERLDALGRPIRETQTGLPSMLTPARYGIEADDPTLRALRRADVGIGAAPKAMRGIQLDENDQREFQRLAGVEIQRRVQRITSMPRWSELSTARQQEILQRAVERGRATAGQRVIRTFSREQIRERRELERQRLAPRPGVL